MYGNQGKKTRALPTSRIGTVICDIHVHVYIEPGYQLPRAGTRNNKWQYTFKTIYCNTCICYTDLDLC